MNTRHPRPIAVALRFSRVKFLGTGVFAALAARIFLCVQGGAPHAYAVRFSDGSTLRGQSDGRPWETCITAADPAVASRLGVAA